MFSGSPEVNSTPIISSCFSAEPDGMVWSQLSSKIVQLKDVLLHSPHYGRYSFIMSSGIIVLYMFLSMIHQVECKA